MIPLYGFLHGDTIGLLIVVHENETVSDLIERLQQAAHVRVPPRSDMQLEYRGQIVESKQTIAQAGFEALDRFDVKPRPPAPGPGAA